MALSSRARRPFPAAKGEALSVYMHVAGLHAGQRKDRGDGLRLSPSTTAIRISSTPRLRSSFMTFSQNLAPLFYSIQMPSTSLVPSGAMPSARRHRFVPYAPFVADLHPQRVEIDHRIASLQRPILPLHHRLQHRIGHHADEVRARARDEKIVSDRISIVAALPQYEPSMSFAINLSASRRRFCTEKRELLAIQRAGETKAIGLSAVFASAITAGVVQEGRTTAGKHPSRESRSNRRSAPSASGRSRSRSTGISCRNSSTRPRSRRAVITGPSP